MKFDLISVIFRGHGLSTAFRNFLKNVKALESKTYITHTVGYVWTKYEGVRFSDHVPPLTRWLGRLALKKTRGISTFTVTLFRFWKGSGTKYIVILQMSRFQLIFSTTDLTVNVLSEMIIQHIAILFDMVVKYCQYSLCVVNRNLLVYTILFCRQVKRRLFRRVSSGGKYQEIFCIS